jgi:hypothetical protein
MVDKSNEYGFVPSSPTQARGSNTGIFEVNDVVDLLNAEQWSGKFDTYDLLGTATSTTGTDVSFGLTGLDTTNYSNLKIIIDWQSTATGVMYGYIRFYDSSGVKTSGYYSANQLLRSGTDLKSRTQNDSKSYTMETVAYGYPQSIIEINVAYANTSDNETSWHWKGVSNGGAGTRIGGGQHRNLDYVLTGVDLYSVPESDASARIGAGSNIKVYGYRQTA